MLDTELEYMTMLSRITNRELFDQGMEIIRMNWRCEYEDASPGIPNHNLCEQAFSANALQQCGSEENYMNGRYTNSQLKILS